MACADVNLDIQRADEESFSLNQVAQPLVLEYKAVELVPEVNGPLHNLLQKQPAVLGSLQMVSGFLSVGVGIFFAVTQQMGESLFTMFRLSHMTGVICEKCAAFLSSLQFIFAGAVSNLLFKYPGLLPLSFGVNFAGIIAAVVAACLISVDLVQWNPRNDHHLRIEVLELCVMGLEVFLSSILCFFFVKEKRAKSP
ncbi:uncharacterized protein si:ch211-269k10.4 isoform X1 [Platichthys flesus]|uniref:uncharacterized protein si:ch211-269k10.4 isoform X1 n=1 Tax=Platichthys flesus TaxID=8260 RepID=UPI002DB99297|nr:uncharacterized protein si:ch211-269k10.4 isoform X1 [Platichthys flesus]